MVEMPGLITLFNLAVAVCLAAWALHLRRVASALQATADALAGAPAPVPAEFRREINADGLIGIRVLNPMELAVQQSRLGKVLAGAPGGMIRREVLRRVVRSLEEQLLAQGVIAEVRIYRD